MTNSIINGQEYAIFNTTCKVMDKFENEHGEQGVEIKLENGKILKMNQKDFRKYAQWLS